MDHLVGTNPDGVLDAIRDRLRGRHLGTDRKLGLVVEGGGMRGVLSAGSLLAVDLLGYRECFDEIYASSAGAVNAAYFLSGQGALGITIYFESINNRRFFNPWRLSKMVDVEYVYDTIVARVKPLDEAALRASRTRLYLSATDVNSGQNALMEIGSSPDPITQILKASSAIPILYNRVVCLSSGEYVDGGATDPMPIASAVERGCTDILVLSTKISAHISRAPNLAKRAFLYAALGHRYPQLMLAVRRTHERSNLNRSLAIGTKSVPGVSIATICPTPVELTIGRTTIDRTRLVAAARVMAEKTVRIFDADLQALEPKLASAGL